MEDRQDRRDQDAIPREPRDSASLYVRRLSLNDLRPTPSGCELRKADGRTMVEGGTKIAVIGKPGCFAAGERVLLYGGRSAEVSRVRRGDLLVDPAGRPARVARVSAGHSANMFRVDVAAPLGGPLDCERQSSHVVTADHVLVGWARVADAFLGKPPLERTAEQECKSPEIQLCARAVFPLDAADGFAAECTMRLLGELERPRRPELVEALERRGVFFSGQRVIAPRGLAHRLGIEHLVETYPLAHKDLFERGVAVSGYAICRQLVERADQQGAFFGFLLRDEGSRFPHLHITSDGWITHNSGKSGIIKNYMYSKSRLIPAGMVVSGTEEDTGYYASCFPHNYIFNRFDEKLLERFILRQKYMKKYSRNNPRAMIVLDDVFDKSSDLRCGPHHAILKNGRHWALHYVVGLQYALDLEPAIRMCFDGVFLCREQNNGILKKLYENFGSVVPTYALFRRLMNLVAKDYRALYIDNSNPQADWQECIYWYKGAAPEDIPYFRFGTPEFWGA